MTLLGHGDGEDSAGASYLELVAFITRHGVAVDKDLEELRRRIVFSICVRNTVDHLRNHGFLLTETGWALPQLMILTRINMAKDQARTYPLMIIPLM